jgi:hypothetical protein
VEAALDEAMAAPSLTPLILAALDAFLNPIKTRTTVTIMPLPRGLPTGALQVE